MNSPSRLDPTGAARINLAGGRRPPLPKRVTRGRGYNPAMRTLLALSLGLFVLATAAGCDMLKQTNVETSVTQALGADPRTKDYKFEVSVQSPGEVLITGTVGTAQEVDAVTEIAKKVKGVTKVDNRCKVEEPGSNMIQDETVDTPGVGTL